MSFLWMSDSGLAFFSVVLVLTVVIRFNTLVVYNSWPSACGISLYAKNIDYLFNYCANCAMLAGLSFTKATNFASVNAQLLFMHITSRSFIHSSSAQNVLESNELRYWQTRPKTSYTRCDLSPPPTPGHSLQERGPSHQKSGRGAE